MSRVAAPNPPRGGGPPYASQHYNNQSQQATYAQAHHSTYPQQSQRPRAPAHRVPKYTVGTGTSKDGKETETLTLGDSDDDDDQTPQAGPSNGAYSTANHHLNGYPPQVYPAAEQPRAGAKRGRNDGQPSQAQAHSGATTSKKRKTGGVAGADPYGGYDQPQVSVTDKEGHYIYKAGNYIYDEDNPPKQYRISRQLGMGTFGKVVKAYSRSSRNSAEQEHAVAVKVIRAVDKYREAAKVEIKVLNAIVEIDRQRGGKYKFRFNPDSQCIHLLKSFMFRKHTCLVTELLGASVFDFLKSNSYKPFNFVEIQSFARQMLDSIGCLHKNGITHTDLKPENILLVDDDAAETRNEANKVVKTLRSTEIRLIDFGSATFDKEYHATVVSTRHYRAPEIILGLGWSHPCDIWSIGCILVEFFTGEALFQTHENLEHLAMMEKVFGPMPRDYADTASGVVAKDKNNKEQQQTPWFRTSTSSGSRHAKLNFAGRVSTGMRSAEKNSVQFVQKMKKLEVILHNENDPATAKKFYELIKNLLRWDVRDRWDADKALNSAFCRDDIP